MSERKNWIAEREKCDLWSLLAAFRAAVKQDVADMNAVGQKRRRPWVPFECGRDLTEPDTVFIVAHHHGAPPACRFEYRVDTGHILVKMLAGDRVVKTRWDRDTCQCRIVVADVHEETLAEFAHTDLWKAVQYILEPFFFPTD